MQDFIYNKQVSSQPEAIKRALKTINEVPALDAKRPIIFTGIGTSFHAARIAAYWVTKLSDARVQARAVEAADLVLHGSCNKDDQLVVISHRGVKKFPVQALELGKSRGALTVLITGFGDNKPDADYVLRTCEDEPVGTHTVSFTTALAVLGSLIVKTINNQKSASFKDGLLKIPEQFNTCLANIKISEILPRVIKKEPIFITGLGIDEITANEAALKIKEATYVWAEGMSTEFAMHGTPAVFNQKQIGIIIMPKVSDQGRTRMLLNLLKDLSIDALTVGTGKDNDFTFPEVDYLLRPFLSVIPFQVLAGELAGVYGSNPDMIRRDVEPYKTAISKLQL